MQRVLRSRVKTIPQIHETKKEALPPPEEKKSIPRHTSSTNKTWTLFRRIEKEEAPHKPRTTTLYIDNFSAALEFPTLTPEELLEDINEPETLLALSEAQILEHAIRRVELLFYTLVAYNAQDSVPIAGWSRLQHGRGNRSDAKKPNTNAAHSSFITALVDETILKKRALASKIKKSHLKIETSILCHTHFMDNLNQTVEVPTFVNDLDYNMEFLCGGRSKTACIIQDVANGIINPIEGLLLFLQLMKKIFAEIRSRKDIFKSRTKLSNAFKLKVIALEEKGTFTHTLSADGNSLKEDYVYMLLRLQPEEIARCKSSKAAREKILDEKMQEMQREILSSPSAHIKLKP